MICPFCPASFNDPDIYAFHLKIHRRDLAQRAASSFKVPENISGDEDEAGPVPYDEIEQSILIPTGAAVG